MSVIKSKRGESEAEFLANARALQAYTIRKCVNAIPKRYTFYIGQNIAAIATRVYELVKCGNSIYPLNQHEAQIRRDYFLSAHAELQNLISQIELANEIIQFEDQVLPEWSRLIGNEIRLVKGILKADRERYKDLPK